jgi:thiazole synthase ThiGH ThiG subunit
LKATEVLANEGFLPDGVLMVAKQLDDAVAVMPVARFIGSGFAPSRTALPFDR